MMSLDPNIQKLVTKPVNGTINSTLCQLPLATLERLIYSFLGHRTQTR
ncbi:hypothetical protein DSUL_170036 [Desulfovibrionales bacterium]